MSNVFLLLVLFLLSVTSLFNHVAQNKLLLKCQLKQTNLQERLENALRAIWHEQDLDLKSKADSAAIQSARITSFVTEVLGRRAANAHTDFEHLYHECQLSSRKLNETCGGIVEDLQQRILASAFRAQALNKSLAEAVDELQHIQNETAKCKKKAVKEKTEFQSTEQLLQQKLDQLSQENQKLRRELASVKAGAQSDSSFFSAFDRESTDVGRTSSDRVKKFDQTKPTAPIRTVPGCEKLAFEFNTKRTGITFETRTVTSANRCKRLCVSNERCQAWTFVADTSECLLKQDIGDSIMSECCVSGVKCGPMQ